MAQEEQRGRGFPPDPTNYNITAAGARSSDKHKRVCAQTGGESRGWGCSTFIFLCFFWSHLHREACVFEREQLFLCVFGHFRASLSVGTLCVLPPP